MHHHLIITVHGLLIDQRSKLIKFETLKLFLKNFFTLAIDRIGVGRYLHKVSVGRAANGSSRRLGQRCEAAGDGSAGEGSVPEGSLVEDSSGSMKLVDISGKSSMGSREREGWGRDSVGNG
jgi:hypothetical protein